MRNQVVAYLCLVIVLLPNNLFAKGLVVRVSEILNKQNSTILPIEKLPTVYVKLVVDEACTLAGKTLLLPLGADLSFEKNGYIDYGEIRGCRSVLEINVQKPCLGLSITLSGGWYNNEVYDTWFEFDNSPEFIANDLINNILTLSDDHRFCHIHFSADRTYYYELPYKGPANIGDLLSFSIKKGIKKRKYAEIYKDSYSYLRIFTIPSNTHLTIQNRFQMLPTNQGAYFVFWEYGKENIKIDGKGTISGDAQAHLYTSPFVESSNYYGEWGQIFCCKACNNFIFEDITLENAFGDCLEYTADYSDENSSERYSKRLLVKNAKIRNARRNGIAVGAKDVVIERTLFEGCGAEEIKGTAPRAAIDFEPDGIRMFPETGNEDVYMRHCTFINNVHDISSTFNNLLNYSKVATYISNCEFTAPLRLNTTNWIQFSNCIIPDITNYKNKITKGCPVQNCIFKDCIINKMPVILKTKSWNNKFLRCKIEKVIN